MCGRYTLTSDLRQLALRFEFDAEDLALAPSYNVAPTQQVLTVVGAETARRAGFMRWGLIPHWAKNASIGARMINARGETVAEKPSFRTSLRRRRCLVLADGFYEWRKVPGGKRPMRIVLRSREPFAFAGLWSTWRDGDGVTVASCAIITTEPNDLMRPIHDRMPVILPRDAEELWLDASVEEPEPLVSLLRPYAPDEMEAYEVSTFVNSPRNNAPEAIAPAGA